MADLSLPTPQDFLLKVPLYEKISFNMLQAEDVLDILYFKGTYDCYCTKCKRDSTFQAITKDRPTDSARRIILSGDSAMTVRNNRIPQFTKTVWIVSAYCTRDTKHIQYFVFLIDQRLKDHTTKKITNGSTIQKIGQHPSFGDLTLPRFDKYKAILDKPKRRELNRAIGLASHDVGIGAYTYLRRVFEALIEEAHQIEASEANWDQDAEYSYKQSRIPDKINLLKHRLPDFLVKNHIMYSLLSKGIHDLTEEECLSHFDLLLTSIELILDEKLQRKEKEKKIREAESALSKAVDKIKK